ncbi:MAG: ABC transporter permease [Clostridiales bacterium]|nr:ABC transporter permease [Clostridiales bacterium]
MYSTPLIYTALGGILSENAGVVNIGMEGLMYFGAFVGAVVTFFTHDPWLGFIAAGVFSGLLSLIHAIACISFKADNTISGLALNFVGPGLALFISRLLFDGATYTPPLGNSKMGIPLQNIFKPNTFLDLFLGTQYTTAYLALIAVLVFWFIFYKTRLGMRIRAIGEYPKAVDTLGINVFRLQYLAVIIGGMMAGFGGASLSIAISSTFNPTLVSGQGFIALAAIVFGKWKPHGVLGACLIFGGSTALSILLGWESVQSVIPIPSQILAMIPFLVSLIILMSFVGNAVAPTSVGVPYEKD